MPSPNQKSCASAASIPRSNTTGAALRRGELKISEPIPITYDNKVGLGLHGGLGGLGLNTTSSRARADGTWPRKSTPLSASSIPTSKEYHGPFEHGCTSYNRTIRVSASPSTFYDSLSTAPSKVSLSKRKNDGFRATIRKMFGNKKKGNTVLEERDGQSRSEPENLGSTIANEADPCTTPAPAAHVSVTTPTSVLTSHSSPEGIQGTKPDDHAGLCSSHQSSDSCRRRNTLPSGVLSSSDAQVLLNNLADAGVRPRIMSGPRSWTDSTLGNFKRRSRSAGALRDLAESYQLPNHQLRERKDEIKYWRDSVVGNPVLQYSGSRQVAKPNEHTRVEDGISVTKKSPQDPGGANTSEPPFDFGPLMGTNDDKEGVEQRVTTLEVKLIDLEYAVAELQGYNAARPLMIIEEPKARHEKRLFYQNSTPSSTTSTSNCYPSSRSPSTEPPPPSHNRDNVERTYRSSVAATIRPTTALRVSPAQSDSASPSSTSFHDERFDTLMSLIKKEQAARRRLEMQVTALQGQLDELRAPTYTRSSPAAYPTPSPELQESPKAIKIHAASMSMSSARSRLGSGEASRFSETEESENDTEDGFLDVYATPTEGRGRQLSLEGTRFSPKLGMI